MKIGDRHRQFHRFIEELSDPEQERVFRDSHLERDVWQARVMLFLGMLLTGILLFKDLMDSQNSDIASEPTLIRIATKVTLLVFLGSSSIVLKRFNRIGILNLTAIAYMILVGVVIIVDQYVRPPDYIGSVYLLVILGNYVLFPLPLRYQVPPTLVFSAALIWIFLTYKEPVYSDETVYVISTIVMMNILGYIGSFSTGRYRRSSHIHLQKEIKVRTELEDTLGKIKTLSGVLPICSSCLKIRDEKGTWQRPDYYIGDHSEAMISHGICPGCADRLYPEHK